MCAMTRSNADIAPSAALIIRHIGPGDVEALRMLAQLDSSREPTGEILVADVGGELWAATSVEDRHTVADPFRPPRRRVPPPPARAPPPVPAAPPASSGTPAAGALRASPASGRRSRASHGK